MTNLPPWPELLAGYVLENLSPTETALVTEYLATHPEAQAELQQLQATLALMPMALPAANPAPALKKRLLEAASPRIPSRQKNGSTIWFVVAITGLAAAAIAGLGWQNYRITQELASTKQELRHQQAMLMQPSNRLFAMKGIDSNQSSVGSLILVPASSKAVLALQKVPPLPRGKVYRMWAYVKDQEKEIACADFRPDRSGQVSQYLPLDKWQNVTTVVVTIEPEKESPEAEGTAVMMGGEEVSL